MAGNEQLKKMMAAQVNYVALMNRVYQAMEAPSSVSCRKNISAA